jgi:hypothetical protein
MRVKLGSAGYLRAINSGYGIGLDDEGHRIEFLYDWPTLDALVRGMREYEPHYVKVEDWQMLAVDDELRMSLSRDAMAERSAFIQASLADATEEND